MTRDAKQLHSAVKGDAMGELDGRVAVITGAGSGMARATTRVFVREGARVLAADISGREKETAAELGDAVVPFHADVTVEDDVAAMFATALDTFGKVDAVLNVAGIGSQQPVADISLDEYDRVMAVDLQGVMLGTKHGIKAMLPTGGGVILNWSSIGGMNGSRLPTSVYSAAKAGVIAFTKAAAIEYGEQGIRANAICPGFIETELTGGKGSAERYPALVAGSALKRAGQPEEVAELASFLASDRAAYISGAVIPIDGASTACLPS
jgi:NAD(P)-dependent dehydrogenase (short-subunit alcohol dehydrogenase family)